MSLQPSSLQTSESALQDLLDGIPAERRDALMKAIERDQEGRTLDILMEEFEGSSRLKGEIEQKLAPDKSDKPAPKHFDNFMQTALTGEERKFFFDPQPPDKDLSMKQDPDPAIFDNLEPKESHFSHPLVLAGICILLFLVSILCYLQFRTQQEILQSQSILLQHMDSSKPVTELDLSILSQKTLNEQKDLIKRRMDSSLVAKEEKINLNFLMAALAFQEGDFSQGRKWIMEGVKLRDEN